MYVTGDFALTLPSAWNVVIGTYDGTKVNQFALEYRKSGKYWVTISQDS